MDHCLETAPYPNLVMAFCGALALQALPGRPQGPRSGRQPHEPLPAGPGPLRRPARTGRARSTRASCTRSALADCLGERFASGEGIQDALFLSPCMLFQTDEIDGMLQSINKAQDARHENIMSTLLTIYSSANSVFPMRRKAGKESPGVIDQPCLVIFGTAIPNHYYEALSERMLTNGFFARMIILECGRRGSGQEPRIREIPERVLETAQWWADFRPGTGNLANGTRCPSSCRSPDARNDSSSRELEAEAEYAKPRRPRTRSARPSGGGSASRPASWRCLYAVSENHRRPRSAPTRPSGRCASSCTRPGACSSWRTDHVADNPFQAECLKLLRKLREAPGQELPHSVLLKRMKIDAKSFPELVTTLEQRGDLEVTIVARGGTPHRTYRLRSELSGEK